MYFLTKYQQVYSAQFNLVRTRKKKSDLTDNDEHARPEKQRQYKLRDSCCRIICIYFISAYEPRKYFKVIRVYLFYDMYVIKYCIHMA